MIHPRYRRTRRLAWEEVVEELKLNCSPDLVRRAMADLGFHKRVPRRKFKVSPINQMKRVWWALTHLHWTYEDWKRVLWTDESSFSTAGFNHRRWVIRSAEEEYHPDCIDDRADSGHKSVMVWGAFCGNMKTDLVFIPSKVTVDSTTYVVDIMEPHLVPFWHRCCEAFGWTMVVEDNAPGHKKFAKAYRVLNEVDVIEWPAQSPDLNLIEALWADLESECGETWGRIEQLDTLKDCLTTVWGQIAEERLDSLIRSMPRRLVEVIKRGGLATLY